MVGGLGDDTIVGGDGIDICVIAANYALCTISYDDLSSFFTVVSPTDGTDHISGVEWFDFTDVNLSLAEVMAGLSVTSAVSYDLVNTPTVHDLTLIGTDFIDGYGNDLDNVLTGNNGENVLDGRGGQDTLIGGLGNDTYVLGSGNDTVVEAANGGWDTITSTI